MASLKKGSHEKESIHGSADGRDPARSGQESGDRGRQEARDQRTEHLYLAKQFGAMDANEVKRLRQLEVENSRLKKIVAERDLEIEVMKEIAAKKW